MASRKRHSSPRFRVGRVSVYEYHGAWWVYYRDGGQPRSHRIGDSRSEAEQVAAQVNAQLASGAPRLLTFEPIGVPELCRQFLDYHEKVVRSSVGTVRRYRAATQHPDNYVLGQSDPPQAHEVRPGGFTAYLREIEVAPNGHPNAARRKLRDKGIRFILETCRSLYLRLQAPPPAALRRQPVLGAAPGPHEGRGRQADLRLRRSYRTGLPPGGLRLGVPHPLHTGRSPSTSRWRRPACASAN
jgi:hypothetical protein